MVCLPTWQSQSCQSRGYLAFFPRNLLNFSPNLGKRSYVFDSSPPRLGIMDRDGFDGNDLCRGGGRCDES